MISEAKMLPNIAELKLSPRALGVLEKLGYNYGSRLDDIKVDYIKLTNVKGCGRSTADEIIKTVRKQQRKFGIR